MNKLMLSAALAALVLSPLACRTARADGSSGSSDYANPLNDFYVAGNLGQTQYRKDVSHDNSVFQNVRFGWRWNGIVGPEVGYVYLGRPKDVVGNESISVKPRAATVGIDGKYNFYRNWYVTAHGGYMRSHSVLADTVGDDSLRERTWNNGWYAGLGVGYDMTRNVSVGVNYDNYRVQYGDENQGNHGRSNVAAFSASMEYRF